MKAKIPTCVFVASLLASCAGGRSEYDRLMDEAQKRSRLGKHDEAHEFYRRAEGIADSKEDEMEARYRAAGLLRRQDRHEEAARSYQRLARAMPRGPRAARAWLDAGRALEDAEQDSAALDSYRVVVEKYPRSGIWIRAAERVAALHPGGAVEAWREMLELKGPERAPSIHYHLGRALEDQNQPRAALRQYEASVRLAPMPRGLYADNALLRIAEIRRSLGEHAGALEALTLLLEHRSRAAVLGSYERSTFARGQMLRGFIYRDNLGRPDRGAEEFARVEKNHPQSRLRDDALWQAAWTFWASDQSHKACKHARQLESKDPESRYAPCLGLICPQFGQPAAEDGRRCERALNELPEQGRKRFGRMGESSSR